MGVEDIYHYLQNSTDYTETHNGFLDCLDEAVLMKLIDADKIFYSQMKDSKAEQERVQLCNIKKEMETKTFGDMLEMSYNEYVEFLKIKYGKVRDSYFVISKYYCPLDKEWYERCINSEEGAAADVFRYDSESNLYMNVTRKGNYSRTKDGLLCHHIDEDKSIYLSDPEQALLNPFIYQTKEHLVYCDYVEHLLLHYKIWSEGGYEELGIAGVFMSMSRIESYYNTDIDNIETEWDRNLARKILTEEKKKQYEQIKELITKNAQVSGKIDGIHE